MFYIIITYIYITTNKGWKIEATIINIKEYKQPNRYYSYISETSNLYANFHQVFH